MADHAYESMSASLLKLPVNVKGRDWYVGDLHGELDLLELLLAHVNFDPAVDRLISVGDLVDRGPDSAWLLRYFHKNRSWFHAVMGNHEAMLVHSMFKSGYEQSRWVGCGGGWALPLPEDQKREMVKIVKAMPTAIEVGHRFGLPIGVVHADFPYTHWSEVANTHVDLDVSLDVPLTSRSRSSARQLWGRHRYTKAFDAVHFPQYLSENPHSIKALDALLGSIEGVSLIISGHSVTENLLPLWVNTWMYIDTGAGYSGGRLTFVDPAHREYVQVESGSLALMRGQLRQHIIGEGDRLET